MGKVYLMDVESGTSELKRIRCKDENKELQKLLENNLDLLPGDQINPESPCRWLLIKREMSVNDPSTGASRWSVDFLLGDQDGLPTLVECKRCDDPRARREVVGQMFEYAANGHYYWTAKRLMNDAQTSNGGLEQLQAKLSELRPEIEETPERYFNLIQNNLQAGKMRLIFFLEESPLELRSVVEFLSKSLPHVHVHLVEARQYEHGSMRFVVPWLFGYTEPVRMDLILAQSSTKKGSRPEQGEEAFWKSWEPGTADTAELRRFLNSAANIPGCRVSYFVSAVLILPEVLLRRGLFGIRRSGELELYFGYWNPEKYPDMTGEQIAIGAAFSKGIEQILGRTFSDVQRSNYPRASLVEWTPKAQQILQLLGDLASKTT